MKQFIYLIFFTFLSSQVLAQGTGNAPYSAIGLGELVSNGFANHQGMGGTGASFGNVIYYNHINPALLVKKQSVAFEVGLGGGYKRISDGTTAQSTFGMNINYLALSLPAKPKWTMGLVYMPYTSMDYESRYIRKIAGSDKSSEIQYKGKGGISKIAYANSFIIGKKLFLGIEGNYHLGSINRDTTSITEFASGGVTELNHLRFSERTSLSGLGFKLGAALQQPLNKKWNLNIGAVYETGAKLNAEKLNSFTFLIDAGTVGPIIARTPDTLSQLTGSYKLPSKYTIGISLESPLKWTFAVDYSRQDWTQFRDFNGKSNPYYTASNQFSAGIEYLPNYQSTKYFNQVAYRVGFNSSQTPYYIKNQQIKDRGFSLGMTIPMGRVSSSFMTITSVLGRRGVTGNSLVQENYAKVVVGFSMNQRWFEKLKID
jgi:hypothetical protein